ncbi:hypothetical protein [Bacillus sp. FJAT-28004]|uniref:hypothetical protein n=1 Tax=Bacillus sp. FJAT-28004 TaxID=1679165 RepID=UPI00128EA76E|nr:hypothetical protein [Bacillus sp. FJAT-28004]
MEPGLASEADPASSYAYNGTLHSDGVRDVRLRPAAFVPNNSVKVNFTPLVSRREPTPAFRI